MAVYAIGDIQGCYDELMHLLHHINFDEQRDTLWFAGDLVNRGPKSLQTLKFVHGLGKSAITVLGNHDLHLLAAANGNGKRLKEPDLKAILKTKGSDTLIEWLQQCPLLHRDKKLGFTLIHAGLPPQWSPKQARAYAKEVEDVLRGAEAKSYFKEMYGNEPKVWHDQLEGMDRHRFITNCFTRLRYCDKEGRLALKEKGAVGTQPKNYMPWYEVPGRRSVDERIIFGHWSTLGYSQSHNVWAIDSGCLWGGKLTALRLDNGALSPIQINCKSRARIG